jgi:hypothetical protein
MPRTEALKRAQKKYKDKILSDPVKSQKYYEQMKQHAKLQREARKTNPEQHDAFKKLNREYAKQFYSRHRDKVKEKNRLYYHKQKEMRQKIAKQKILYLISTLYYLKLYLFL